MTTIEDVHAGITRTRSGSWSIPSLKIMSYVYSDRIPDNSRTFGDLLAEMERATNVAFRTHPDHPSLPSKGAIANCNGRWAEYMYACEAWNAVAFENSCFENDYAYVFAKLPTNSSEGTVWTALLTDDIRSELASFNRGPDDPAVAESGHDSIILYSSNPDAMLLRFRRGEMPDVGLDPFSNLTNLNEETMASLDRVFDRLRGAVVPSENIVAFLSMKTSLRPDRRYQFVHEGDSIKSVLMYVASTRRDKGLTSSRALDFLKNLVYTISFGGISEPDKIITNIAMSACVSSPFMGLIWAVDRLYSCEYLNDVAVEIDEMIENRK